VKGAQLDAELAARRKYEAELIAATREYDDVVRPIRERTAHRQWRIDRDYEIAVRPFAHRWGERVGRAREEFEAEVRRIRRGKAVAVTHQP